MTRSLYCLVGFAAWAVLLVLAIAAARVFQVLTGKKRANEFPSGVPHGGDGYWRLNRAHVNTVENLPIYGSLILAAALVHVDVTLPAEIALLARLAQSLVHISSGRSMAVNVRFTAFATQIACYVTMMVKLLSAPAS
jgi:MAPEG family